MLLLDKIQKISSFSIKLRVIPSTLLIMGGTSAVIEYEGEDEFPYHGDGIYYYFKNSDVWFAGVVYYKIENGVRHNYIRIRRKNCYPDMSNTSNFTMLINQNPQFDVSVDSLKFFEGNAINDYINYTELLKTLQNKSKINNLEVGKGIYNQVTNELYIQSDNQSDYSLLDHIDEAKLNSLPISVSLGSFEIETTLTQLPFLKLYGMSGDWSFKFRIGDNFYNYRLTGFGRDGVIYGIFLNKSVIHDNNIVVQVSFEAVKDANTNEWFLSPKISSSVQDLVDIELSITQEFYLSQNDDGIVASIQNISETIPMILNGHSVITIENELYRLSNINELRFTNSNLLHSIAIPDNMDIVNYSVPGFYHKNSNISTLHSIPDGLNVSFSMIIMDNGTQRPTLYMIKDENNKLYLGSYFEGHITWYDVRAQLTEEIQQWVINNFDGGGGGDSVLFIDISATLDANNDWVFTYTSPTMDYAVVSDEILNNHKYPVVLLHFSTMSEEMDTIILNYLGKGMVMDDISFLFSLMSPSIPLSEYDENPNIIYNHQFTIVYIYPNGVECDFMRYPKFYIECGYTELFWWKNEGKLIPGAQYLIEDYETVINSPTVTENGITYNTHKCGKTNPFNLLVKASDKETLLEECFAVDDQGRNGSYYSKAKMNAWKIWYDIENDRSRYDWAPYGRMIRGTSTQGTFLYYKKQIKISNVEYYMWSDLSHSLVFYTINYNPSLNETMYILDANNILQASGTVIDLHIDNGKGVIYRMIDELGNDIPYDFKNIQVTFDGTQLEFIMGDDTVDYSIQGIAKNYCYKNVVEPFLDYECYKLKRHHFGMNTYDNYVGFCNEDVYIDIDSYGNRIGKYNGSGGKILLNQGSHLIKIGDMCSSITVGDKINCELCHIGDGVLGVNISGCQHCFIGNDVRYIHIDVVDANISHKIVKYLKILNGTNFQSISQSPSILEISNGSTTPRNLTDITNEYTLIKDNNNDWVFRDCIDTTNPDIPIVDPNI